MIVRFNLLPYRLIERQQQRQRFYIKLLITLAAALSLLFLWHWHLLKQQEHQGMLNQILESAGEKLAPKIRQVAALNSDLAALKKQLQLLEDLRKQQLWYGVLLVDLTRQIPKEVSLSSLKLEEKNITLTGHAASMQALSQMWQNLNSEAISMEQVELNEMRNAPSKNKPGMTEEEASGQDFVMIATLRHP